ncbi:organelle RRM domain-containing protein 2, mitochondrial [Beta vulgaris subsp. vulgaris]|uniref:organelle RRM domain-containing protein 2, mitochondrial n=1 Tax=Beta vulgaris subsp. vulgaris TaxID=3555 RepID=UPI002037653F|nr:organelle RRM domain-containing protein 2, mitochondrial [Beta vulgaris subsp. vulgaris]
MAFAQNLRNIYNRLSSASPILQSQLSSIRLNATLTSPKLFVSGLSRQTTDEKFKEAFAAFGELVEAKVVVDRPTGKSKGFGFVTYANIEDAERAREGMNSKFLDGWVIFVDPAKPREPRPPPQHESQPQQSGFTVNKTVGWCGQ